MDNPAYDKQEEALSPEKSKNPPGFVDVDLEKSDEVELTAPTPSRRIFIRRCPRAARARPLGHRRGRQNHVHMGEPNYQGRPLYSSYIQRAGVMMGRTKSSSGKSCFGLRKGQQTNSKTILRNASGYVRPGELVAIMGASGAGKSTLLNALTFRNLSGSGLEVVSGARYANGVAVTPTSLTSVSAYIQQDDLFIGTLTVRETLEFQSRVRMDPNLSASDRKERVNEVIRELGLKKCEKTLIGIQGRIKGISGGEMKRLAFACEILTNPPLLFCDEPTSGLDSYMAQNVVEVLRTLAVQGKTIVCTIHQPSSQVFELFDRVLLMAEGRLAYLGSLTRAQSFFKEMGHPCPENYNPADHYVQVMAIVPGNEDECRERVEKVCDTFTSTPEGRQVTEVVESQKNQPHSVAAMEQAARRKSPYKASWGQQFAAVLTRSWKAMLKEPLVLQVRFAQTFAIALILGIVYLDQEYTQQGVMNMNGALFLMLTNMTFQNMFGVVNVFCVELPVFLREHFNGMYRVDVYFISKQLAELPIYIIAPLCFVSIFYWMVGLNSAFEAFAVCCCCILVLTQVVVGFGYLISCIASDINMALALAPPLIIPLMLFGGFFLNVESIPNWLVWLEYLSWFRYANEILVVNQWETVGDIQCPTGISPNDTKVCPYPNGDAVITQLGYSKDNMVLDWCLLAALAVAFRILAFLALLSKTRRKGA